MARTGNVEAVLREALDTVARHGVVLIHGEYGVVWGSTQEAWTWDREMFQRAPHCDCVGAFMITKQPGDPPQHKGDIFDAAVQALGVDNIWLRDLMNGFDNFEYQGAGGYPDAHALGVRLRTEYRPLCFEYIALAGSGVCITDAYREYLREFCVPARRGLTLVTIPTPAFSERPSGVYPTLDEEPEDVREDIERESSAPAETLAAAAV